MPARAAAIWLMLCGTGTLKQAATLNLSESLEENPRQSVREAHKGTLAIPSPSGVSNPSNPRWLASCRCLQRGIALGSSFGLAWVVGYLSRPCLGLHMNTESAMDYRNTRATGLF